MKTRTLEYLEKKHEEERKYNKVETIVRTAIYTRQSLDKKDSISIETQLEECKKLLKDNEQYKEYNDKGFSGKNTDRPSFKKMIKDIERGKVNKVIVYKLDRFTRSVLDFYQFMELLKRYDCDFVSAKERDMDTSTATGRAMIGMVAIFAQLERETIQLRVKDNYYSRIARDGRWAGGPSPYGFKIENHRLIKIDEQIEAVKIIYNKYYNDNNISLVKIKRDLEELNYKTKTGKNFRVTALRNILKSTVYVKADKTLYHYFESIGVEFLNEIEEWNGTKSAHMIGEEKGKKYTEEDCKRIVYLTNISGFIDSNVYIQIQKRLSTNKQIARGNADSKMEWLAGLLKCGHCGYAIRIYTNGKTDKKYLGCFGKTILHSCNVTFSNKVITFNKIKYDVANKIQEHITDLETITQNKKAEWKKIQQKIEKEEKEINKLIELSILVDVKEVAKKIKEKQLKINQLKLRGDYFTEEIAKYEDIDFIALKDDEKKKICQELIEKIMIFDDGKIKIKWKI